MHGTVVYPAGCLKMYQIVHEDHSVERGDLTKPGSISQFLQINPQDVAYPAQFLTAFHDI